MAKIDVADYYRRLGAVGVADVAARLLEGRITKNTSAEIRANCPRHDSDSGTALHISPHEGLWYCHACGVGGDALQLVEFIQSGTVSKGTGSGSTDGHRAARDWLAGVAGMPPLSEIGASAEDLERAMETRAAREATFQAMTQLAIHYHAALVNDERTLQWLSFTYGITRATVDQLKIGWADEHDVFDKVAAHCDGGPRALASTGAFQFSNQDHAYPFFRARVVFPYWSGGQVVYMIGRRVPWSPAPNEFEHGKYKKLPNYNESLRPWISRAIDTTLLCGEDVLLSKPAKLVVVEGYTDWAVLKQAGFAAVALTSAHISNDDFDRVVRKLRGVGTVYLAQDNELSAIGIEAAIKTARLLDKEGVRCMVATVPPMPKHADAREKLAALIGADGMAAIAAAPTKDRAKTLRARAPEGKADDAEKLWDASKVDVAEFFANGGTAAMFDAALDAAKDATEAAISRVERVEDPAEMARAIAPLLAEISQMRPAARQKYMAALRGQTGLSVQTLKAEASVAAKGAQGAPGVRHGAAHAPMVPTAEAGSCLEVVERDRLAAGAAGQPINWSAIAEKVYTWLADHGAKFFRDRTGAPAVFWENEIWPMTGAGGTRSRYEGLIYRLTGAVPTTAGSKTFYSTLAALAADRGTVRDAFPWIHTDVARATIWVNLNNARHEIARISAMGVEIVRNGDNVDGVILSGDQKFLPFDYDPTADAGSIEAEIDEVLGSHLACRHHENKSAIVAWLMCLPLIGFSGTRPMIRFEGPAGCIAGETRIWNPIEGRGVRVDELVTQRKRPWVMTLGGPVLAEVPFVKGMDSLYRVTLGNGRSCLATADHLFLSRSHGWIRVGDLAPGIELLSGLPEGGQHSKRIGEDSLVGCHRDRHSRDRRLPYAEAADQCRPRSIADARERTRHYSRADALASESANNQTCLSLDRLSTSTHSGRTDRTVCTQSDGDRYTREPSLASFQFREQSIQATAPLSQRARQDRDCADTRRRGHAQAGDLLREELTRLGSSKILSDRTRARDGEDRDTPGGSGHVHCRLCGVGRSCLDYTARWSPVSSVEFERFDVYYDLHVPGAEHYLADGMWSHNSGKTWAAKMITTLVYGDEAQKKSTDAANYADAARNPLVALDNVEVNNATPALIDFLLTSVTGIVREKRAAGSDSGVVSERPTCLVMSTGIEPLAGELEEVMSRSFIVDFDSSAKDAVLLEKQSLSRIKSARPRILSAILKRASAVLGLIADGAHETAMHAVRTAITARASARCDEYIALMYLQVVAAAPMHNRDQLLCELAPSFIRLIGRLDQAIVETARDSSQVATPMVAMFMALAEGKPGDAGFGLKIDSERRRIEDVSPTMLFIALRQVARDRGVPFPYKNAAQFGVRLKTSLDVLRAQGISTESRYNAAGAPIYTFKWDIDRGASTRLGPSAEADAFLGHEPREVGLHEYRAAQPVATQMAFGAMGSGSAEDTP